MNLRIDERRDQSPMARNRKLGKFGFDLGVDLGKIVNMECQRALTVLTFLREGGAETPTGTEKERPGIFRIIINCSMTTTRAAVFVTLTVSLTVAVIGIYN